VKILHWIDRTNEVVGKAVSLLMVPMLLVMIIEVLMRYGLDAPTIWGTETATFLFAGYILLGGGYALLTNSHVNMNALYNRLSRRLQAVFDLITSAAFFLYCSVLLWQSSKYTWDVIITWRHTGTDWNPPLAPFLVALPIGVLLMLVQGTAKFIRDVIVAYTGKETHA
jgi:TRAP-type mannitol/chloroaromatic compound transport system permease small subunit